ncbi:BlaI/MecI/CopY family transcriptional regulator [Streptomyces sp. NPDC001020]
MSETRAVTTELTSQYTAQVSSDLERNVKEQERISAEVGALQQQLAALQQDHALLVNMHKALGITAAPAEVTDEPGSAVVPAPRKKGAPASATSKRARERKTTAAQGSTAAKKPVAKKPAVKSSASKPTQPTLVELVRRHLTEQGEPRSAAEVATALGKALPERGIKTTVVRTTLEGLVAKNLAQRSKQGTSVYYTAPDAEEQKKAPETETAGPAN